MLQRNRLLEFQFFCDSLLKLFNFKLNQQVADPRPQTKRKALGLAYLIDENPPWYTCLLLGFQVGWLLRQLIRRILSLNWDNSSQLLPDFQVNNQATLYGNTYSYYVHRPNVIWHTKNKKIKIKKPASRN